MDELEYELAITNHNGWIRILPMHMISPITMDELELELCYHQLQRMNSNMNYAITNHNGWIWILAMLLSIVGQ